MTASFEIRQNQSADFEQVLALYPLAFPDEDLTGLVRALLTDSAAVNLIALQDSQPVGHLALCPCPVTESDAQVALLGPLAVHPDVQKSGIGRALIQAGVQTMERSGVTAIVLAGDPQYYGPQGFKAPCPIAAPYELPASWHDAWQIRVLSPACPSQGQLMVPPYWAKPEFWG